MRGGKDLRRSAKEVYEIAAAASPGGTRGVKPGTRDYGSQHDWVRKRLVLSCFINPIDFQFSGWELPGYWFRFNRG